MKSKSAQRRLPSLSALRTFEVVARSTSITAAAEQLYVTPGAVSRQIRLLESELELALFDRTGNTVKLNSDGQRLARKLAMAFEIITAGIDELQPTVNMGVSVTSAPSFASKWLVEQLSEFRRIHPEISISLEATDRLVSLDSGDADIAIRFMPYPIRTENSMILAMEELFPVCNPGYLKQNGPWETPGDLLKKNLLHADWNVSGSDPVPGWKDWFTFFYNDSTNIPEGLHLKLLGLAVDEAVRGRGVALGPKTLVAEDIEKGLLVAPFGASYRLSIPWCYCLVWSDKKALSPAAQLVSNWLAGKAQQNFPILDK